MAKKALITGVTGQDGAYLAAYLVSKGYEVYGTYRRTSTPNFWRLQALDILQKIILIPADLTDMASLLEAFSIAEPQEVYNLAAQSYVGASFEKPQMTTEVDGLGTIRLLEAIRLLNKDIRFYQASTSEIYGNVSPNELPLTEQSVMKPSSPYGAAKLYAFHVTRIYRESYGIFAVNGILFNHESPLRGLEFVTRKISNAVARIALRIDDKVYLGNLEARRDWGYAPEYVEAMWLMLQQDNPEDYIIATGEEHSVREFAQSAFSIFDLDYERHVIVDQRYYRPLDVKILVGDASKARTHLGWKPTTTFKKLVRIMVETDFERWKRYLSGDVFPWDAPNYPSQINEITRSLRV